MVRYIAIPDTAVYGSIVSIYLRGFRVVSSSTKAMREPRIVELTNVGIHAFFMLLIPMQTSKP